VHGFEDLDHAVGRAPVQVVDVQDDPIDRGKVRVRWLALLLPGLAGIVEKTCRDRKSLRMRAVTPR
jgi:hypothetical protein